MENDVFSDDWGLRLTRLTQLIARKTEAIQIHLQQQEPDRLAIEQYQQRRAEHIKELADMMHTLGIELTPQTLNEAA